MLGIRGLQETHVVVGRQGKDYFRVHITSLQTAIERVWDGFEACGEHVACRYQDWSVQESIFEIFVAFKELLAEEGGVLDMVE
jgi:hypothetical protein